VVVLVLQNGLIRKELHGPAFRTRAERLRAPRVTQRSAAGRTTVRWAPVRDAAGYRVFITGPGGLSLFFARPAGTHALIIPSAGPLHVRIQPLNGDQVAGG
jgi:hypothetical protein